jgi:hypothetical protein
MKIDRLSSGMGAVRYDFLRGSITFLFFCTTSGSAPRVKKITREENNLVSTPRSPYYGQSLLVKWTCIEHGQCVEDTGAAPASLRSGSTRLREHFGGSNLAVYLPVMEGVQHINLRYIQGII